MPSSLLFLTKYIFRTLHMASFAILFGNYALDYLFGQRHIEKINKRGFSILFHSSSAILLISGLINMIILVKENKYVKKISISLFW